MALEDIYDPSYAVKGWFDPGLTLPGWFDEGFTESGAAGNVTGTLAYTEDNDTLAATAFVGENGTLAYTEGDDTLAATGTVGVNSTLTFTEGDDTVAASGTVGVNGTLAFTEGDDTAAATGNVGNNGTLAFMEEDDTAAFAGTSSAAEAAPTVHVVGGYRYEQIPRPKPRPVRASLAFTEADDGALFDMWHDIEALLNEDDELMALLLAVGV